MAVSCESDRKSCRQNGNREWREGGARLRESISEGHEVTEAVDGRSAAAAAARAAKSIVSRTLIPAYG